MSDEIEEFQIECIQKTDFLIELEEEIDIEEDDTEDTEIAMIKLGIDEEAFLEKLTQKQNDVTLLIERIKDILKIMVETMLDGSLIQAACPDVELASSDFNDFMEGVEAKIVAPRWLQFSLRTLYTNFQQLYTPKKSTKDTRTILQMLLRSEFAKKRLTKLLLKKIVKKVFCYNKNEEVLEEAISDTKIDIHSVEEPQTEQYFDYEEESDSDSGSEEDEDESGSDFRQQSYILKKTAYDSRRFIQHALKNSLCMSDYQRPENVISNFFRANYIKQCLQEQKFEGIWLVTFIDKYNMVFKDKMDLPVTEVPVKKDKAITLKGLTEEEKEEKLLLAKQIKDNRTTM
ncbi:hypothetical protein K501DRAFT_267205 [Backusella circina FSU 941]|nr:hypothetical protein K501DRAFT_267205 [Backusella circina FSU 941]